MLLPSSGKNNYYVQPSVDFIFQLLIILTILRPIISLQHPPFIIPDKLNAVPDRPLSPFLTTGSDAGYQGNRCYTLAKILKAVVAGTP
jgi:hypothetical protein